MAFIMLVLSAMTSTAPLAKSSPTEYLAFGKAGKQTGRSLSLNSVYTTSGQQGLPIARTGFADKADRVILEDFIRKQNGRSTNALIAKGDSLKDAIEATFDAFVAAKPVDEPVCRAIDSVSKKYWLMAFLGEGSHGTEFYVSSIEQDEKSIRLIYFIKEPSVPQPVVVFHYYWVSVGALKSGVHTIELFNSDLKHVTFSRRVNVR